MYVWRPWTYLCVRGWLMVKFYVAEACYIIGETKRALETSLKEHKSAIYAGRQTNRLWLSMFRATNTIFRMSSWIRTRKNMFSVQRNLPHNVRNSTNALLAKCRQGYIQLSLSVGSQFYNTMVQSTDC